MLMLSALNGARNDESLRKHCEAVRSIDFAGFFGSIGANPID
jgi:hypothetical protein